MAVSYFTLEPGTLVTDRFGQPVGTPHRPRLIRRDRLLATDHDRNVAVTQL